MATIVCVHAHPDDEALLTGGTIARLSAEGHRVVLVVATDGGLRLPESVSQHLSRLDELRASAGLLGAARVAYLGYADSGHGPLLYADPPDRQRFARADAGEAADRLVAILREEDADLLVSYDAAGGYGHRDHLRVHQIGSLAAERTGIRVLAATRPREQVVMASRVLRPLRLGGSFALAAAAGYFTPRTELTHRVNVRTYAGQKQAALRAHSSQLWPASRGRAARVFWLLTRLPTPVFGLLLGTEWFAEPGTVPGRGYRTHVLD